MKKKLKQFLLFLTKFDELVYKSGLFKYKFFCIFYYKFFSNSFNNEMKYFGYGQYIYYKNLKLKSNKAYLRRNIHRIEKGLITKPIKNIFGKKYIIETLTNYESILKSSKFIDSEIKWFRDVILKFFETVTHDKIICKAYDIFLNCEKMFAEKIANTKFNNETDCFAPFEVNKLKKSNTILIENFKLLCKERHSLRDFSEAVVEDEKINKIIDIAYEAPSACNRQSFRYIVIKNKEKISTVACSAGGANSFYKKITCLIAVIGDFSSYSHPKDRHLVYIDSALSTMQLLLAAQTVNVESCIINWPDSNVAEKKFFHSINLKQFERPIMLIALGYAKEKIHIPYSDKKESKSTTQFIY